MILKPKSIAELSLKKFSKIVLGFYSLLAFGLGLFLWLNASLKPVDISKTEKITFVIDKGESVAAIIERLAGQNLIKSRFCFKSWVLLSGISKKIKAGSYYLSSSMNGKEVAESLTKGANDRWVTIIEGLRSEQIGELLIKKGFAVDPKAWAEEIKTSRLEGQLFPDSYLFPTGADQEKILGIIRKNFQKKVTDGLKEQLQANSLSLEEILTLASIIEREASKDADRKIIAGILLKRLESNWPLQVDASIQYAVSSQKCSILNSPCDWWPNGLTQSNLQIKSPYNTYLYTGLPPSPICNPSLSSITAVLSPQGSAYWYYLSGSDELMHYAKTHDEHAQNIKKFLK